MEVKDREKKFLRKLELEQFKVLIFNCLTQLYNAYSDSSSNWINIKEMNLEITPIKDWDIGSYIVIKSYFPTYQNTFLLNDFSMEESYGYHTENLDEVLHKYLVSLFGEEYIEALYKKRIEDAMNVANEEKENLKNYFKNNSELVDTSAVKTKNKGLLY